MGDIHFHFVKVLIIGTQGTGKQPYRKKPVKRWVNNTVTVLGPKRVIDEIDCFISGNKKEDLFSTRLKTTNQ